MSTVKTNNVQVGQSGTATNNFTLYQPTSPDGTVRLGVGNSGATTSDVLVANSSGNFGLGVTPSAWGTGYKAFQIGDSALSNYGTGYAFLSQNALFGTSTNTYINSAAASYYRQFLGTHAWFTAPSGTAGNAISFTQALTLNANGALVLQGGNTSASGVGIAFPATQSASTDANTLDDYEEGSWTPTYTSTGATFTYTGQNGRYIKVGNLVWVSFALQTSNVSGTTTNALYVTGLPFTPLNSPGNYSAIGGPTSNFNAVPTGITESPTGIALYQSGTVSVQTPTTAGLASTTKYLWGSMVYTV